MNTSKQRNRLSCFGVLLFVTATTASGAQAQVHSTRFSDLVMRFLLPADAGKQIRGDVNNDGTPETVRVDDGTGAVYVEDEFGNRYGVIQSRKPVLGVEIADVDGNGRAEIVVMHQGSIDVSVYDEYGNPLDRLTAAVSVRYLETAIHRALEFRWQQPANRDLGDLGNKVSGHEGAGDTCFYEEADITWNGRDTDDWGRKVITGTEADEVIVGTNDDDRIIGGGGADVICGLDGDDWIYGDEFEFDPSDGGSDIIDGGLGDDVLFGGGGYHDVIHGNEGEDALFGGFGWDTLHGEEHHDSLIGMWGSDTHYGGDDDDWVNAFTFDDSYAGDTTIGDSGYDTCHVNEDEAIFPTTVCEVIIEHCNGC